MTDDPRMLAAMQKAPPVIAYQINFNFLWSIS
jgi:hypothetical protein